MNSIMSVALAPNTMRTYRSGIQTNKIFCIQCGLRQLPLVETTLQRFVASSVYRLSYRTLKVYLAGIQYWSIMVGFDVSLAAMPRLYYLLRAVRRIQGNSFQRRTRLPITTSHLRLMFHRLEFLQYGSFQKVMFKAVITLAFFGLLRVSEYTSNARYSFNQNTTLLRSDISFNNNFSIMFITVKASKTDPFRSGCVIRIAAVEDPICPVKAMRAYLQIRSSTPGPLFQVSMGSFLIRQDIVLLLRRCLPRQIDLNTHSFRIGGASMAAAAGIPDSQIQILGRWASDAYKRYLRISDSLVTRLCAALVSVEHTDRVWDSVGGLSRL